MRMVEGRQRADAHELLGADFDLAEPLRVVEMRHAVVGHSEEILRSLSGSVRDNSEGDWRLKALANRK
jgi:hypothetical protein